MDSIPRVFVSASSRDLGSYRKSVADVLRSLDVHAVIQDDFPPDYHTVVEMLRDKIAQCDAVICLVGSRYGYEPLNSRPDEPRRSYTQLEHDIATNPRTAGLFAGLRDARVTKDGLVLSFKK